MSLLILAAVGFVVGIVLLAVGLRGRRVDDHPLCHGCGRDLFGLKLYGVGRSKHCPECGVALDNRAFGDGNRVRRGRLVIAGTFLLVPCVLWLGGFAAIHFGGVEIMSYKPVWLLVHDAGGSEGKAAVAELRRRLDAGEMSRERATEVVADFLDDQADLFRPWSRPKGTFVEHAAVKGLVSLDDWQRYVTQAVTPGLRWRPKVTAGRVLPLSWPADLSRFGDGDSPLESVGAGSVAGIGLHLQLRDADGHVVTEQLAITRPSDQFGATKNTQLRPPASLPAGRMSVTLDVTPLWPVGSDPTLPSPGPPPPRPATPTKVAEVEIVPAGQPTVFAVESPEMKRIFAQQYEVSQDWRSDHAVGERSVGVHVLEDGKKYLDLNLEAGWPDPLPVALAVELWVEWGDRHARVADLARNAGSRLTGASIAAYLPDDFDADTVTVRMTPSAEVAEATPDITEYWNGERVWENVKVDWSK